tara:strand:+ start:296 stop:589 length:294 start_codon:yes stop_codon:yes gene_type:complete
MFKEHLGGEQRRLDRIEAKIDKLAEVVVKLARVEEKLETLETYRHNVSDRVTELESRTQGMNYNLRNQEQIIKGITRLFWVVLTASATAIAGAIFFA